MFLKLAGEVPAGDLRAAVNLLCDDAGGDNTCADLEILTWITAVFATMSQVVAAFNYLQVKFHAAGEGYVNIKENALKAEVLHAMTRADALVCKAASWDQRLPLEV